MATIIIIPNNNKIVSTSIQDMMRDIGGRSFIAAKIPNQQTTQKLN